MRPGDLKVQHRYVQANGLRFHLVEKGSGPLVMLLHGFPEHWWSWRYQIDPLVEAGFRVVAPDQRGYNDSDKQGPYDIDTLATDIKALVLALDEKKAHIVGHDWGGGVAWHFAGKYPELVEKLVVLNCPHPRRMMQALTRRPTQLARSWYMFFFQVPLVPELAMKRNDGELIARSLKGMAKDRSHFKDEEIQPFRDGIQKPGAAKAMVGWYRAIIRRGLVGKLPPAPEITAPTLMIWAMDDRALGYDDLVPGTERYVRDLRIERINDCGHFVQSEQPGRVNPLMIDFLRGEAGR